LNVYAESSAVLAWLLDQSDAGAVSHSLAVAEVVVASDLTMVECDRVLLRGLATDALSSDEAKRHRDTLNERARKWVLVRVDEEVVRRARRAFPVEPLRSLDAIHLSTAISIRNTTGDLSILTLDHRIRANGEALGFEILPGRSTVDA